MSELLATIKPNDSIQQILSVFYVLYFVVADKSPLCVCRLRFFSFFLNRHTLRK